MTYDDIWSQLEASTHVNAEGIIIRRLHPEAACDLFLAVAKPSNQRTLLIQLQTPQGMVQRPLPVMRGIEVTWVRPVLGATGETLQLTLLDQRFAEVFTQLVSDLVKVASRATSGPMALSDVLQRLLRWQKLLEEAGNNGLGRETQQGLYGEIWFLRERLLPEIDGVTAVAAWTGPTGAPQDFQLRACAVEVKTVAMKEPQRLIISNERQLDDSGLKALFLFALSVEAHEGAGETLNELIASVRMLLQANVEAYEKFEERLLETGYLQAHVARYEGMGYTIREFSLFQVRPGFPRVVGADLKDGVGDVHYSVALTACRPFATTASTLVSCLSMTEAGDDGQ